MSRFRMPPRVAPSPAAGEPGLQNAAARLRSSREVQAKLLHDQRALATENDEVKNGIPTTGDAQGSEPALPEAEVAEAVEIPALQAGETGSAESTPIKAGLTKSRKEKLVVPFRLPHDAASRVSEIARAAGLSDAYVLKSLAKEGRAVLRGFADDADVNALAAAASTLRSCGSEDWAVAEPMTVYVRDCVLDAMHNALGDPWKVMPKATVVGAFFIAIVLRLIETRRCR